MKTAIVYDKVTTHYGGAEQVLQALHKVFPKAPLFTSVYGQKQAKWARIFHQVNPSFLQKWPFSISHYRWYLPLMPLAFESLDLSSYDLIISVTSGEAKGIITQPDQFHLCYLLTPARYLYSHQKQYLQSRKILGLPVIKQLVQLFFKYLKWWDQAAVNRPDLIIPISQLVGSRVGKYYHTKPGPVIYPPIDVPFLSDNKQKAHVKLKQFNLPKNFLLIVSRLVAYKEIDLAIEACLATGKNLVIVGNGPELRRLKKLAFNLALESHPKLSRIIFLGQQPQTIVNQLYQRAQALLMPAKEDFGITALQACYWGTPTILHQASGAAEMIKDQVHGLHLRQATLPELIKSINLLSQTEFHPDELRKMTQTYTTDQFLYNLEGVIKNHASINQGQQ